MAAPLATHTDRLNGRIRLIEVFETEAIVSGRNYVGGEYRVVIPFDHLEKAPSLTCIDQQTKRWSGALASLAGLVGAFLWIMNAPTFHDQIGFWVSAGIGLIGIYLFWHSFHRIDVATFHTTAGVARLSVVRDGPGKNDYDQFIELLINTISKNPAEAIDPNPNKDLQDNLHRSRSGGA